MESKSNEFENDNRTRNLKKILERQGYMIEEPMIIVLGEAVTFLFKNINYSLINNINLWYGSSLNVDFEKNVLRKLNIDKQDFLNIGKDQYIDFIYKKMKDNFVICYVDDELFKNYKTSNSSKMPTVRNLTSVEVCNLDLQNKEIMVEYDGNNTDEIVDNVLKLPFDKFVSAAYSNSVPVSPNGSGYLIEKKKADSVNNYIDLNKMLLESILNICRNNLGKSHKGQDDYIGVIGIKQLLTEVKAFHDYIKKDTSNKEILDKIFSIRFKILRKTLLSGSNSLYRIPFAHAVEKLSALVNNKQLEAIGKEIFLLGRRWVNFNRVISIANMRIDKKDSFFKVVYKDLHSLQEEEAEVLSKLEDVVSKLLNDKEE